MKRHLYIYLILAVATSITATSCKFISINEKGMNKILGISTEDLSQSIPATSLSLDGMTEDFSSIELNGGFELKYSNGEPSITVNAAEEMYDKINMSCEDGKLVISVDKKKIKGNITIFASSPALEYIVVNGAVDFEAENLVSENLEIEVNGAGDIDIEGLRSENVAIRVRGAGDIDIDHLDCDKLYIDIKGAAEAEFKGKARSASIEISGAGDVDIRGLQCNDVRTSRKGLGKINR